MPELQSISDSSNDEGSLLEDEVVGGQRRPNVENPQTQVVEVLNRLVDTLIRSVTIHSYKCEF